MKTKKEFITGLSLLILIIVIPFIGFQLNKAPKSVPESAPLTEFSAERAMQHMKHIAAEPHAIPGPLTPHVGGNDERLKALAL